MVGEEMMQGQSEITPSKEAAFHGILTMNLRVHKTKWRSRYHHFDLNAGCGYNHQVQCTGSPLVFLSAAAYVGEEHFAAYFVDSDRAAIEELLPRIEDDDRCTAFNGDNREFVKAIPDLIRFYKEDPTWVLGSILCDPNGTDLPIPELAKLSQRCPRLDFIINYPARIWKRERGAGLESGRLHLDQMVTMLNKREWWIQTPLKSDRHEWMILIGRNYSGMDGVWRKMRIYRYHSPEGRECLRRSYSQRESTDSLF